MRTWLALLALCVMLAAVPALGEPGDEPGCPWEHMPYARVLEMEEIRDAQTVGGVKGSPYWLWQAYLGSGSVPLRLYEVSEPIFPRQLLFKERIRYAAGSEDKVMTLTVGAKAEAVELRLNRQALWLLERAGITRIDICGGKGIETTYACAEILSVMDYFAIGEEETLCLQGEDAPLYKYCADGFRYALTAGN